MTNLELLQSLDIDETWVKKLNTYLPENYLYQLASFITKRRKTTNVYPESENVFKVFKYPYKDINAVILGQDPYYNPKVATGLAFESGVDTYFPPSLANIKKEIELEYETEISKLNLDSWHKQGVMLLNTALTVEENKPGSHANPWKIFTQVIIKCLQDHTGLIYLLWGNHAKAFKKYINPNTNYILEASHPSPLGANKGGWFGCNHFKTTNEILEKNNGRRIIWY